MKTLDPSEHDVEVLENVWIPLPDGGRMAARIWLPAGARERPAPAIFEYLPYRKRDLMRTRDDINHGWLAAQGFACVRVDMRGSGESDGLLLDQYREQELTDGEDLIKQATSAQLKTKLKNIQTAARTAAGSTKALHRGFSVK